MISITPTTAADTAPQLPERALAPKPAYRWDINIYRALAVLAVLLFHLRIPGFERGFLGVDLFFLISGYVITQSLERSRGDKFSAGGFFLGRVYRIFPMVGVTVLFTLVLAIIFLAPTDLVKAAQSGLATLFSVANIYFWATIDYFDPASAAKPLLHMWSLGVEEQFYLVFPLIFIAFASLAGRRLAIAIAFALTIALSIGLALSGSVSDSSLFYLLPFRMNQFLAGSLAFYIVNASLSGAFTRKAVWIVLSGALLALSLWLDLPEEYRLSVLLTFIMMPLFVINLSRFAEAGVFAPLHRIADWSYSIYVLHWPIIAFWVVVRGDLDMTGTLICGAATIGLAWLTYRFIERPFQKRRRERGSWKDALKIVIAPMGVIAALALALILSKGLAFRVDDDLANTFEKFEEQREEYFATHGQNIMSPSEFSSDKVSVVIMGDSFAGDMNAIVREVPGVESLVGAPTTAYCRALTIPKDTKNTEKCEGNWAYLDTDFSNADIIFITEISASRGYYDDIDEKGYEAVFKRLRDNGFTGRFVLAGIRPIYQTPPYQTAYAAKTLDGLRERVAKDLILDPTAMNAVSERMSKWAETQDITLFPLFPLLCDMDSCAVTNADKDIIYVDQYHLSPTAFPLLREAIEDVFVNNSMPLLTIPSNSSTGDISSLSDDDVMSLPNKFDAVRLALLRSDTESATRLVDAYLDELQGDNISALISELWSGYADAASRRGTILLAERQLERTEDWTARYIAGVAYYGGVIVTRDDAKIIKLWEHPSMKKIGVVQFRLSRVYGNPDSDIYDPEKAAQRLAASQELGYQPKTSEQ